MLGRAQDEPVLEVDNLQVSFQAEGRHIHAVSGVSFDLMKGETLAIAGESGSGKSVTAQAIMGLIETPPGHIGGGDIRLRGESLLADNGRLARKYRGREIGMVFQDALAALNPGFSVGFQIAELFRVHARLSRQEARSKAVDLIDRVGIPNAGQRVDDYPHQFSGGMRQRIAIAMAIALNPKVIIADEPTTALDVTVQAQIMDLLSELKEETGAGVILITHDLALVSTYADRLAVMYAGRIVERGPANSVISRPTHPYTKGLIDSVPSRSAGASRLKAIPGQAPDLGALPAGCAFEPRCWLGHGRAQCITDIPSLREVTVDQRSACHFAEECVATAHAGGARP
jgi:oligopeptide transport system ATP-binding protein